MAVPTPAPKPEVPAEELTVERARTVMEFAGKGGPLRDAALKHVTPAMLSFMEASGGELRAFAATFGRMATAGTPAPIAPAPPKAAHATDARVSAVMAAAIAIDRHSSPLLVDRLADRLAQLYGDGGSRGFFASIGHALRNGSIDPRSLREAIDASLAAGVKSPPALFAARIGTRLGRRPKRR